jgi:hypothetical protein
MGLVQLVPVGRGLTILVVELRTAGLDRCLPARLLIPGLRGSRNGEDQQCDDTGGDATCTHDFAPFPKKKGWIPSTLGSVQVRSQ